jgi:hypothetical protein
MPADGSTSALCSRSPTIKQLEKRVGLFDCQFHSLTIMLRDNARYLRACVWRGILGPKNSEILIADGREHRREVRGEKRERASLLVHGARIAVNDEASEPNAPSLCRYRGEFNPKIRKFEQVRRSGLDSILVMTANESLPRPGAASP